MRQLSNSFMQSLQTRFLSGLLELVRCDVDLDLEIRDNYLNIYYKGNSLLKLDETRPEMYRVHVHSKFLGPLTFPDLVDENTANLFLAAIPTIKENILRFGRSSIETEYEQLIIRANNYEPRNTSEYFIVDRQVTAGSAGRFDLTGFFWPWGKRRKGQTVSLCLIEVKYALNQDIQNVHEQIERYYQAIKLRPAEIAVEVETVFRQKLELGLFDQPENRLSAMKTLIFSRDLSRFQFILILVDYNPYSRRLNLERLANLPYASQIKVFQTGFAMWKRNLKSSPGFI